MRSDASCLCLLLGCFYLNDDVGLDNFSTNLCCSNVIRFEWVLRAFPALFCAVIDCWLAKTGGH